MEGRVLDIILYKFDSSEISRQLLVSHIPLFVNWYNNRLLSLIRQFFRIPRVAAIDRFREVQTYRDRHTLGQYSEINTLIELTHENQAGKRPATDGIVIVAEVTLAKHADL
jgi:hypothetical protein